MNDSSEVRPDEYFVVDSPHAVARWRPLVNWVLGWSDVYPPFDFTPGPVDNGAFPLVTLHLPVPGGQPPRSAALNVLKAIPHYVVIVLYAIAAVVVAILAWFAVLFTGAWPRSMRSFLIRFTNYYYRVWSYVTMVENDYPRFGLR